MNKELQDVQDVQDVHKGQLLKSSQPFKASVQDEQQGVSPSQIESISVAVGQDADDEHVESSNDARESGMQIHPVASTLPCPSSP